MPASVATTEDLDLVVADIDRLDQRVTTLEGAADPTSGDPAPGYDDSALVQRVASVEANVHGLETDADLALGVLGSRVDALEARPTGTSGTTVGLPYTVITTPTDAAVQAGLKAWRSNFNGEFPKTKLAFAFSGTANLTTPLDAALGSGKIQGARWEGLAKRSTVLAWSSTSTPMLSTTNVTFRNYRFRDFSIKSNGSGVKGWWLYSDQAPKNNSDGAFTDMEWLGGWDYAIALAGGPTANENSEVRFEAVGLSNDAHFDTAWLWSGANGTNTQQNQFLNYEFRNTKFEHSHGDVLRFDYGGSIHCTGFNSWIMTGNSAGGNPSGRFIYLPRGNNFDSTMFMDLTGIRPELRNTSVKLLDSAWSGAGNITIQGVNSASYASRHAAAETITLRGDAAVLLSNCYLDGFVGLRGSAKPKIRVLNVASNGSQGIDWNRTDGLAPAGIRTFDTATTANLKVL